MNFFGKTFDITFPPCTISYPSCLHSWDRTKNTNLFFCKKLCVTSGPKYVPAPRKPFGWHPSLCCGSLQSISNTCSMRNVKTKRKKKHTNSEQYKTKPDQNKSHYISSHPSIISHAFHLMYWTHSINSFPFQLHIYSG